MVSDRACTRATLVLPWLLNGSLAAEERCAVREHLIGCAACRAELARTREVVAMAQLAGGERHQPVPAADLAPPAGLRSPGVRRLMLAAAALAGLVLSGRTLWLATQPAGHVQGQTVPPSSTAAPAIPSTAEPAPPQAEAAVSPIVAAPRPRLSAGSPAQPGRRRSGATLLTISFESGSVASLQQESAGRPAAADSQGRISALGFENGLHLRD